MHPAVIDARPEADEVGVAEAGVRKLLGSDDLGMEHVGDGSRHLERVSVVDRLADDHRSGHAAPR
jgi:hypothetical protein